MSEILLENIDLLLRRQRSPKAATRQFRQWKHNRDILPKLQRQLEILLEAHNKFEPIVYDTQGILDDGTDIAIRYRTANEGDEDRELIGFQVKSFDDLSKPDYMKDLKAQRDDSFRKVQGLIFYFILLCTDSKKHKDRIRNVSAEFRSAKNTKVIEPEYTYTFLNYPSTSIDAFVKRTMQAGDIVFRRALLSVSDAGGPSAQALAIFLAIKGILTGQHEFTHDEVLNSSPLRKVYAELRDKQAMLLEAAKECNYIPNSTSRKQDYDSGSEWNEDEPEEPIQIKEFETQLTEDFELLENEVLETDSDSNNIVLITDQLYPLHAIIADALARYEYEENDLMSYMFSVMGVTD